MRDVMTGLIAIWQLLLQSQAGQIGDGLIEWLRQIYYYLNQPFIDQKEFKVSLVSLLAMALVILIAFIISRYLRKMLGGRVMPRFNVDSGVQYTITRLLHFFIVTIGVLYALKVGLSVDLTSLAVIAGFLSVGIGFGLQYLAADIASGFILLFERPIRVNDRVSVGDIEGNVDHIGLRATTIITNDNVAVIVPNSKLTSQQFINWSYGDQLARLHVPVGVAYGSDVEKVSSCLLKAAEGVKNVVARPEPGVRLVGFGDSSLNFELLVWTARPHNSPQIKSDINFRIERIFRENSIIIPFPQRDLHLRSGSLKIDENGSSALAAETAESSGQQA